MGMFKLHFCVKSINQVHENYSVTIELINLDMLARFNLELINLCSIMLGRFNIKSIKVEPTECSALFALAKIIHNVFVQT